MPFVRYLPLTDHPTIDVYCNAIHNPCYSLALI
jgi:hypothetical protein